MKIYFAGSIRGGRDDKELYLEIINLLGQYGKVLTEHVGADSLTAMGEDGVSGADIYQRDMAWLSECDLIVAEVTTPSLGVGYEIAKAEDSKPVLCLYRDHPEKSLSAMLAGNHNITVKNYQTIKDAGRIVEEFLSRLSKKTKRF